MNKIKSLLIIALLLACASAQSDHSWRNIPIRGQWDPELPGHFMASNHLEAGDTYTIRNGTRETIYVWLLEDDTPIGYFPLMAGDSQEFVSPGDEFDLYLHRTNNHELRQVTLQQEKVRHRCR